MCLIAFALDASPRWALILAANRDEWHARPAAPLAFWADAPHVAAGRDLQAGGTWMGTTRDGRFAALTNVREPSAPPPQAARSRGELVAGFLTAPAVNPAAAPALTPSVARALADGLSPAAFPGGPCPAADHAHRVHRAGQHYAGFNLLLGDLRGKAPWWWVANRAAAPQPLGPGLHGLSNGGLGDDWPKVRRLRQALADSSALDADRPGALSEADALLLSALASDLPPADHELPDTGVGLERERQLGAAFVRAPGYGTRVSTLLRVGRDGRVRLLERTWPLRPDAPARDRRIEFTLEPA